MTAYSIFSFVSRFNQCGCVSTDQWSARSIVLPGTDKVIEAPLCQPSDTCPILSTNKISTSSSLWDEYCSDCKQACTKVDYSITTSAVNTINDIHAQYVKTFVERSTVPLASNWSVNWRNHVQNNYIAVEVVCESTMIENFTQQASISSTDVLSNVGGLTGLWIGISFLSIMEVIEMLFRLAVFEFKGLRRYFGHRISTVEPSL